MTTQTRPQLEKLPAVIARTALSRSTVYDLIKAGKFPAPIRLSANAVAWNAADVDQWITNRIAAQAAKAAA